MERDIGQLCSLNSEDLRKWYYTSNPICNFTESQEENHDAEINSDFDGNQTHCVNTTFEEYIHKHERMCSNYFMGELKKLSSFFWHYILIEVAKGHNFATER